MHFCFNIEKCPVFEWYVDSAFRILSQGMSSWEMAVETVPQCAPGWSLQLEGVVCGSIPPGQRFPAVSTTSSWEDRTSGQVSVTWNCLFLLHQPLWATWTNHLPLEVSKQRRDGQQGYKWNSPGEIKAKQRHRWHSRRFLELWLKQL
jgi:hypothetical protein